MHDEHRRNRDPREYASKTPTWSGLHEVADEPSRRPHGADADPRQEPVSGEGGARGQRGEDRREKKKAHPRVRSDRRPKQERHYGDRRVPERGREGREAGSEDRIHVVALRPRPTELREPQGTEATRQGANERHGIAERIEVH